MTPFVIHLDCVTQIRFIFHLIRWQFIVNSFHLSGIYLWHSLPIDITASPSIYVFKTKLFAHLLAQELATQQFMLLSGISFEGGVMIDRDSHAWYDYQFLCAVIAFCLLRLFFYFVFTSILLVSIFILYLFIFTFLFFFLHLYLSVFRENVNVTAIMLPLFVLFINFVYFKLFYYCRLFVFF